MCTVSNKIENSRLNSYICPHSVTPLASKTQIPPRCGRDYTKETGICRQHSAARHNNGGKPEDAPQQYRDVTTIRQTRHFRSWRRQISRWRRLWSKHTGGGGFLPLLLRSFNVLLALAYFAIRYTHRTTVVLWYNGLCDIRVLFMHDANQGAWRITPIRFNNVRLSPLIFRPKISGLLRPRVLKPLHYPTRASRNEVSNVGAIVVGLHSTQVPNSCRKWNSIYSYSCSHSQYTVYGAYHSSMSCLNVSSSFPPMPRQIDVWTVSNLTFVLLSFKLLHSTTEVPFIVLAIYSLRSGTLKRVNGDATRDVCRLRKDVSEALYAISCDKRRSFAYRLDLLCSVILFVGCTMCVASSTSMITWCDHCIAC